MSEWRSNKKHEVPDWDKITQAIKNVKRFNKCVLKKAAAEFLFCCRCLFLRIFISWLKQIVNDKYCRSRLTSPGTHHPLVHDPY